MPGDATGGDFTLTLPSIAAVTAGRKFVIKNAKDSGNITVARNGSDTIDGLTSVVLSARASITVVAPNAGADWMII